jgi:hypothetical protein
MNPVYVDAAFKLQSEFSFSDGSKLVLGESLFGGEWGVDIDMQVMLLDGVPAPSDLKDLFENVNLQVLVRGEKLEEDRKVYGRAYEVMRFFLNLPENTDLNGCIYKGFEQDSGLLQLGKDDNDRFTYSFNLSTQRGVLS